MNKLDIIIEKFLEANDLKSKPLTKEAIIGTADFTGFSDGYKGHPHKYEFNILGMDERMSAAKEGRRTTYGEAMNEIINQEQKNETNSQKEIYNLQYDLGKQIKSEET